MGRHRLLQPRHRNVQLIVVTTVIHISHLLSVKETGTQLRQRAHGKCSRIHLGYVVRWTKNLGAHLSRVLSPTVPASSRGKMVVKIPETSSFTTYCCMSGGQVT